MATTETIDKKTRPMIPFLERFVAKDPEDV